MGAGGAGVATALHPASPVADPPLSRGPATAALAQDMLERAERRSKRAAQRTAA